MTEVVFIEEGHKLCLSYFEVDKENRFKDLVEASVKEKLLKDAAAGTVPSPGQLWAYASYNGRRAEYSNCTADVINLMLGHIQDVFTPGEITSFAVTYRNGVTMEMEPLSTFKSLVLDIVKGDAVKESLAVQVKATEAAIHSAVMCYKGINDHSSYNLDPEEVDRLIFMLNMCIKYLELAIPQYTGKVGLIEDTESEAKKVLDKVNETLHAGGELAEKTAKASNALTKFLELIQDHWDKAF